MVISVRDGDMPLAIGSDAARDLILEADVVVVGDVHSVAGCLRTAVDVSTMIRSGPNGAIPVDVGLALEYLAPGLGGDLDRELYNVAAGHSGLQQVLRRSWPFPVAAIARMLAMARDHGITLLPAGGPPLGIPGPDVPDRARRPPEAKPIRDLDRAWTLANQNLSLAARGFLFTNGRLNKRKLVVCYGLLHLFGTDGAVVERLEGLGFSVVVLLPFVPELEVALHMRLGDSYCGSWIRIQKGVLRPPTVCVEEASAEEAAWRAETRR